jgi:FAD/FMN-containing dehydrogenase
MDRLSELRACFNGRLYTDDLEAQPFVVDWRKQWRGACLAVAQPDTVEDVASVVKWCASTGTPIVAQGGNTGLSGGATPDASGNAIVLSLTRLNRVRGADAINNTITVDAGVLLSDVQLAAAAVDRFFPLSLAAEGTCTIGGNLATNAGGTAVLRYGTARELCLGLEVVTATSEVWNGLRALRKDNTGYDLRDLFIGSEGTLGIITGAVMKLFPKPIGTEVVLVSVATVDDAVALFALARNVMGQSLSACELINPMCVELVETHSTIRSPLPDTAHWIVLLECESFDASDSLRTRMESLLETAMSAGLIADAVIAESDRQRESFWALRENVSEAQGAAGPTIKHDIAIPISSIVDFVRVTNEAVRQFDPDLRFVTFGHLGDGNLHYNFSPSATDADPQTFVAKQERLNEIVHDHVRTYGGSISAEHGLGVLRRDEADRYRSDVERRMQHAVKRALDPLGILNPGKVLPPDPTHIRQLPGRAAR